MRVFAVFLALCLTVGCTSKPDYCVCATPVTTPKTATFWIDTFDVEVVGKNDRFGDKTPAVADRGDFMGAASG